jgi:mannose-6-phosphate isomerase-like protein (cupin superfamily)
MSDWQPKAWGRCRTLYCDEQVEVVEAEIVAGGYSSAHKHLDKDNTFIVLSGEIEVLLYPASLRPQSHVLRPSLDALREQTLTVQPHVPHKFVALQATRLIEVYRAFHGKPLRPGDGDICRFSEGGVRGK